MKKIRILHVFLKMDKGGAETVQMKLFRNIDRKKIVFDFAVQTNDEGDYDKEIEKLGGKIYHFSNYNILNSKKYEKEWDDFFDNHTEYDIIVGHIRSSAAIYLKSAKRHNLYTICYSHNTKSNNKLVAFLYSLLTRKIPKYADYYFGISNQSIKDAFGMKIFNSNKWALMKNGINLNDFYYDKKTEQDYRNKFNLNDKFIIGHVGRFEAQKNHFFLIDIFEQIHKKVDNSVLILVGRGSLESKIKEYINSKKLNDSVMFLGVRDDVNKLMMMFDAFVFPSVYEGFGNVLLESQAAGLKTFTSNVVVDEIMITNDIYKLDLNDSSKNWADFIIKNSINYRKKDNSKLIKKSGFDLFDKVKEIEKFYIEIEKEIKKNEN